MGIDKLREGWENELCGDWHPGKQVEALDFLQSKWVTDGGHGSLYVRPVLDLVCQPSANPPGLAFRRFEESKTLRERYVYI